MKHGLAANLPDVQSCNFSQTRIPFFGLRHEDLGWRFDYGE
jgi:hypothetical protein